MNLILPVFCPVQTNKNTRRNLSNVKLFFIHFRTLQFNIDVLVCGYVCPNLYLIFACMWVFSITSEDGLIYLRAIRMWLVCTPCLHNKGSHWHSVCAKKATLLIHLVRHWLQDLLWYLLGWIQYILSNNLEQSCLISIKFDSGKRIFLGVHW